jgi:hypothetical protein
LYLKRKVREVGGNGELQEKERPKGVVGEKRLRVAGVAENQS